MSSAGCAVDAGAGVDWATGAGALCVCAVTPEWPGHSANAGAATRKAASPSASLDVYLMRTSLRCGRRTLSCAPNRHCKVASRSHLASRQNGPVIKRRQPWQIGDTGIDTDLFHQRRQLSAVVGAVIEHVRHQHPARQGAVLPSLTLTYDIVSPSHRSVTSPAHASMR